MVCLVMTSDRLLKSLVLIFSLAAGSLLVWQLTRNISGESSGQSDPLPTDYEKSSQAYSMGSKSPGGSLDVSEHFVPEEAVPSNRPLLPGSKVRVVDVFEEVDEAWEFAVPPFENKESGNPESEEEE